MNKITSSSIIYLFSLFFALSFLSCESKQIKEINIGYIGPLSVRATDLGIDPSNAMQMAVDEYNANRLESEPKVNLFIEDGKWNPENAVPAYNNLRDAHKINVLFVSNTDATVSVQDLVLQDHVILVNPLNNDELLSSLNKNTFKIAKSTEQANGLIAGRIKELGLKKVALFQYPNDYMTRASNEVKNRLDSYEIASKTIPIAVDQTSFTEHLIQLKAEQYDAYAFFGYKELGFAMKEARDLDITAPFFGSTVLLDPAFYKNSEGAIQGTEFPFFTPTDGNYILAHEFLTRFENTFSKKPASYWPTMQAYDAMNLILSKVKTINAKKDKDTTFDDWLREALYSVNYYQGICGNIAINKNGASKGIYFSLYQYGTQDDPVVKTKR